MPVIPGREEAVGGRDGCIEPILLILGRRRWILARVSRLARVSGLLAEMIS